MSTLEDRVEAAAAALFVDAGRFHRDGEPACHRKARAALAAGDAALATPTTIGRVAEALAAFDYPDPAAAAAVYAREWKTRYIPAAVVAIRALLEIPGTSC